MPAIAALADIRVDFIREAFEHSGVGLAVITPEGILLHANPAFCRMTGYACEQLLGRSCREITHPSDAPIDEEHLRAIRAGGSAPPTLDKRFVKPDGSEVWVRAYVSVLREGEGPARAVVCAFVDLTDQ